MKWWMRWKQWVKVVPDGSLQFLAFTVKDKAGSDVPL